MVVTNARLGRGPHRSSDVWLEPDEVRWFTNSQLKPSSYRAPGPVWRQSQRAATLIGDGLDALSGAAAGVLGPEPALAGAGALPLVPDVPRRAGARGYRETRPRGWSAERKRRFATRFVPTVTVVVSAAVAAPLVLRGAGSPPTATEVEAQAAPTVTLDGIAETPALPLSSSATAAPATELLDLDFAPAPAVSEAAAVEPVANERAAVAPEPVYEKIEWRRSEAHGAPFGGHLHNGVRLPIEGPRWVTWDPVYDRVPNRENRLYATDSTIRKLLAVMRKYHKANPNAPKVVVGDLSLAGGGPMDAHVSHQNGLDIDIYYPRRDRQLKDPRTADRVNMRLSQQLVDLFVAAGAQFVFVGYNTPFTGPSDVVQAYPNHENHMHVRFRP